MVEIRASKPGRKCKIPKERWPEIVERVSRETNAESIAEVAKAEGVARQTIKAILVQSGVTIVPYKAAQSRKENENDDKQ